MLAGKNIGSILTGGSPSINDFKPLCVLLRHWLHYRQYCVEITGRLRCYWALKTARIYIQTTWLRLWQLFQCFSRTNMAPVMTSLHQSWRTLLFPHKTPGSGSVGARLHTTTGNYNKNYEFISLVSGVVFRLQASRWCRASCRCYKGKHPLGAYNVRSNWKLHRQPQTERKTKRSRQTQKCKRPLTFSFSSDKKPLELFVAKKQICVSLDTTFLFKGLYTYV